jgi:hypothetical protein
MDIEVEPLELLESLRMEVQIYIDDNERIIRSQEEKNHINTLLL